MKRLLSIILILLISIGLISCVNNNASEGSDEKKELEERKNEVKEAEKIMKEYLELLANNDTSKCNNFLTKKALEKKPVNEVGAPKVVGYKLKEIEHIGKDMSADVDILETSTDKPYYGIMSMVYTLKKEDNKILIDNINEKNELAFYIDMDAEEKGFYVREGKCTTKDPVIKLNEFPNFMLVETSIQPQHKVQVDRNNINNVSISAEGKHMLFSSNYNNNSTLIIAERLFQASNMLTSEGEGGGNSGSIHKEVEGSMIEIDAIDFFKDSKIEYTIISPNGESISCKVNSKKGSKFIIYSSYSKEPICKKLMENFNSSEYIIVDGYYNDDNQLILKVKNKSTNKEESYEINIKEEKFKKIES